MQAATKRIDSDYVAWENEKSSETWTESNEIILEKRLESSLQIM